jgi:hypothetical protein
MLFLTVLSFQSSVAGAQGATLYVNRVVVAMQGDVGLGAIIRSSGTLSLEQRESLARSVTVLGPFVQYLPMSSYANQLESAFGENAIIVGSKTVLIPKGTPAEEVPYLLDRLGDFLAAQGLAKDGTVEVSLTISSLKGTAPQDGTPLFQVLKTSGGIEISFVLTGASGNAVSGHVKLASGLAGADTQKSVKVNSPVQVNFHKGPITVEMPGKALSTASVGDNINVFVAEDQKTFTGRVISAKEVQVDLP